MKINFTLNGKSAEIDADPMAMALDVIRDLDLTGTKEGCGVGVCGACTIMVDGEPVSSCICVVGTLQDREVWTVEGISEKMPDLIEKFIDNEGMQCGICTPGQIMAAAAISSVDITSEEDIKKYMAGNLCRCTGYQTILNAVEDYLAIN
ncbi:MAG: (2Fe-2S)-binding protein [Actinobacteria bacterium]|jgi:carbon-monoxide dehydrogenase small subunit|nr:(2Fe-2S)-binding protein [Actinomycetota bacterium]